MRVATARRGRGAVVKTAMASIPYTMHSAVNLHKKLTEEQTKNLGVIFEPPTSTVETTLPKYNPKLMNSIWGLYNRYAPHSFQKNCEIPSCSVPGIVGAQDKPFGLSLWNRLH
nr:uncharacterized protein LOC126537099 isoform X1 [Dermacentor andersoni]XP_054929679.1 uncharacterized protein LOC126537099 isoform X1 [Dermacentor andersoni]